MIIVPGHACKLKKVAFLTLSFQEAKRWRREGKLEDVRTNVVENSLRSGMVWRNRRVWSTKGSRSPPMS